MSVTKQATFIVMQDGEIDTERSVLPPTAIEAVATQLQSAVGQFTEHITLQARMAIFDRLHGTHYRRIRNELMEQRKREAFERTIGLERK